MEREFKDHRDSSLLPRFSFFSRGDWHNFQPDVDSMALINAYAKECVAGTGAIAEQVHATFEQELIDINMTDFDEIYKLEQCYHISYKLSLIHI